MVIKEGKKPHLCYDTSKTKKPTDIVMNQVTPVAQEAPITFGKVKIQPYINIYNTRISYSLAVILLAMGDIKACFLFTQIHAAFSITADDYYNLATAIIFGSTTSALSWEPFQQAIERQSEIYADKADLASKHEKYFDMIGWAELDPNTPITPAVACKINISIFAADRIKKILPA